MNGLSGKYIEKSQIKMMGVQDIVSLIYDNFSVLEIASVAAGATYEKFNNYAPPLSALVGMYVRVFEPEKLQHEYSQAIDRIRSHYNIPLLSGTSDIYSYGQSYLIASDNQWNPRPIFQGYSVYARGLAEKNRQHLLGLNAPDNVFLKVETIDYRLPAMDDGASWPVLLTHYDLIDMQKDLLILKKKNTNSNMEREFGYKRWSLSVRANCHCS